MLYGAYISTKIEQNLSTITVFLESLSILEFDQKACASFAEDKEKLKRNGNLIPDMDLMIASIAKVHNYSLVTNNMKHFERINSLKLERWL